MCVCGRGLFRKQETLYIGTGVEGKEIVKDPINSYVRGGRLQRRDSLKIFNERIHKLKLFFLLFIRITYITTFMLASTHT